MIKIKVAFLEGRLSSSQSEQSKKFSKSLNGLEKSRPSKKATLYFDHVNRQIQTYSSKCVIFKNKNRPKQANICDFLL